MSYPSVKSFFQTEVRQVPNSVIDNDPAQPGDGFTAAEIEEAIDPLKRSFNPVKDYSDSGIIDLKPGPGLVAFMGRVVNFCTRFGRSKNERAAKGWHLVVLRDDTAIICVTIYFITPYDIHLGLLISVWTAFVAQTSNKGQPYMPSVPIRTSIFPGRDPAVHIILHSNSDSGARFRTPSDCSTSDYEALPGLMTVQAWLNGGNEVSDVKILAGVKSIGPKKSITTKENKLLELQEIRLFDDTGEATLKLWNASTINSRLWTAGKTVLLISEPQYKLDFGKGHMGLGQPTMVDVEPDCPDAAWLRRWMEGRLNRESLKMEFNEDVFDAETFQAGREKPLFTIKDVEEWAKEEPKRIFIGYLSLVITDMELSASYRRNMLMCNECCGMPIYSNAAAAKCENCSADVALSLNSKIMGTMIDETGCIKAARTIWTATAWQQTLDQSPEELMTLDNEELQVIEEKLLGSRLLLLFGWSAAIGRVVILGTSC